MLLHAENGCLALPGGAMDFVRFGRGGRALVIIPGLGDGLKTVRGMALPLAWTYREAARTHTVYMFSRSRELPPGCTIQDMADELERAMEALALGPVRLLGVSQGGMIAQRVAADHPGRVEKLILAVTAARPNPMVREAVSGWIEMARRGDYAGIMRDTAERSYSPARLKRMRPFYGLLTCFGRPRSLERFITQAGAILGHDAWDALAGIACPTLVIGGCEDRIVGPEASREIAERIPGSALKMYEGLGHALYEEAPDFLPRILEFCKKE